MLVITDILLRHVLSDLPIFNFRGVLFYVRTPRDNRLALESRAIAMRSHHEGAGGAAADTHPVGSPPLWERRGHRWVRQFPTHAHPPRIPAQCF